MKSRLFAWIVALSMGCTGGQSISTDRPFDYLNGTLSTWVGAMGKTRGTTYEIIVVPRAGTVVMKDTVWVDGLCLVPEVGPTKGDTLSFVAHGPVKEVDPEPLRGQPSTSAAPPACTPPLPTSGRTALIAYRSGKSKMGYVEVPITPKPNR